MEGHTPYLYACRLLKAACLCSVALAPCPAPTPHVHPKCFSSRAFHHLRVSLLAFELMIKRALPGLLLHRNLLYPDMSASDLSAYLAFSHSLHCLFNPISPQAHPRPQSLITTP